MANGNGKKNKKKIIVFSVIGLLVIVLVALVFLGSRRETIIAVQTEKVQRRTITQIVSATGKMQPETQVKMNAEVSGEIISLPIAEGERVVRGQLLCRIKPDAYQAQFERAQAALAMNQAALMKSEAEFTRVKELYAKKLVADADMDIARAGYESAKAAYDQSRASVKEARETLAKTTIYSPMDGVVSQLNCELGERVSGSTFTQGTEIMTIADLSRMEARVDVGENDVVLVAVGDTARVAVDAYPDRKFVGTVTQIANTAKSTGLGTQNEVTNFEVRILVHTPPGVSFRPGMSLTADIETETKPNVLAVPIQSVTVRMPKKDMPAPEPQDAAQLDATKKKVEDKPDEVVFLVKDGVATTAIVKRGISDDSYVEVSGKDLEGADVVSGPFKAINRELENGAKVKVESKPARHIAAAAN